MKRTLILMMPAVLLLGLLSGCGDNFPDEELHFGLEQKTRPFAVVIEPPEAQPGQEVTVTLLGHSPRPEALDISWRVALDYDLGLYEVDEIERNYRPVPSGAPTFDLDGFFTQSFTWTVPDSSILLSSALPEVLTDPILANLARVALGLEAGAPVPKSQVDSWLGQLSHLEYLSMDPDEQAVVAALADRFACQVRLRATLDDGDLVDVTRNLTVRHARRLPTANVNENTFVDLLQLVVLEKRDAEESDLHDQDVPRQVYWLSTEPDRPGLVVEVPFYRNRSYFLILNFDLQQYEAPYEPGLFQSETGTRRWYYYRRDDPTSGEALFITDQGDDAEMFDLDNEPRIDPAGVGAEYRLVAVARDLRDDWVAYHATPGTGLAQALIRFVAPPED